MRNVVATIREVSSGIVAVADDFEYPDDYPRHTIQYMFSEGNYSCDCNLELFFRRARGEDPDLDDVRCSDGRFVVDKLECDGEVIEIY